MIRYTVTTARPLSPEKQEEIKETFRRKTEGEFSVLFLVNDELIGGMTIFDGEQLYDGSIKYRLEKMKGKADSWKKN